MASAEVTPAKRVGCYIDGFNLYFGMREAELRRFYWLNVSSLASGFLADGQVLAYTKYFTARIIGGRNTDNSAHRAARDAKRQRQTNYLEALESTGRVQIIEGHYREDDMQCNGCGRVWSSPEEKMTDVNIATQLIFDAFANVFDIAIIVSGDSDLVPPIREIKRHITAKRIYVAFPPARYSNELRKASHERFRINAEMLENSQFPDQVHLARGYTLTRPESWK